MAKSNSTAALRIPSDNVNIVNERLTQARAVVSTLIAHHTGDLPFTNKLVDDLAWAAQTLIGQAQDAMKGRAHERPVRYA